MKKDLRTYYLCCEAVSCLRKNRVSHETWQRKDHLIFEITCGIHM